MQLNDIPRTFVRISLDAARTPLTVAEAVLGKGDEGDEWALALAFDNFEAKLKQILGGLLGDEELVEEGRLRSAKIDQLRKAAELESVAAERKARADNEFKTRSEADEQRRVEAEQRANDRESKAEKQKAEAKARVEDEAQRKQEAAEQLDEATKDVIAKQERAARSVSLSAESDALRQQRDAVAAKAEVLDTDKEIEVNKSNRKGGR